MWLINSILQLANELIGALLVEELSWRVRRRFVKKVLKKKSRNSKDFLKRIQERCRERLRHRISTSPAGRQ